VTFVLRRLLALGLLCVCSANAESIPQKVWNDQKAIWRSPLTSAKQDAKWWLLFGGATGALLVADRHITNGLPNTPTQLNVSSKVSRAGTAYILFPAAGAFALTGAFTKNEKARDTGLLAAQAMVNAQLVVGALKLLSGRERPVKADGKVDFGDFGNGSFPSGHAMGAFAFASVVAHQYRDHRFIPWIAYGAAGAIASSRVSARRHFASDVLVGSAMGWFIGRYVVKQNDRRREIRETFGN
jgi:membrane-associated phospholipid phosphatase